MSAPKPAPPKPKTINVLDLRPGMKITGMAYLDDHGVERVKPLKRPVAVKTVDLCGLTKVHVNGSACYDSLVPVEVG